FQTVDKSLAEFRVRRRERALIVFSDDMRVRKNSLRGANVRFVRVKRTNRALSGVKPFRRQRLLPLSTI
ncbi:MAG: hypothetical protein IJV43_07020, partial [Oscillospiraceae bacterium]|nr:hypothetical protein [Oscillospiraceae bacterium]